VLGLALMACVGWVAFNRDPGTSEAAPPAHTTPPGTTTHPAATTPSPSTTNPPQTTTTSKSLSPTPSRTPGPGEVYVPDVTGMFKTAADYAVYSAGLNPVLIVTTVPNKCSVKETDPPKGSIVPRNSTVKIYVEEDNPKCQPL